MEELERRDYDVNCFKEDARFLRCKKECIGAEIWGVSIISLALLVSYQMSGNPEDFTYLFGYPAWYVIATLVMALGGIGTIIFALKIMSRPKLTALDEGEEQ